MRKYYFINLPNDNIIHALDVCIGENDTQKYSLDRSVLFVKTNNDLIDAKVNKGTKLNSIFPNGLTEEVTYEEAKIRLNTLEFSLNDF